MKRAIVTKKAPSAIGPYSQAMQAGNTVYVSGQLPIDPKTGTFPGDDIESQTRQSLENIKNILNEVGLGMKNVVKTTVLLQDIQDFTAMNQVYGEYFEDECPARAAFQVARLPRDAKVEIEAVAWNEQ